MSDDELASVKRIGAELNDDDMTTLRRAFNESEDRSAHWRAACNRMLEQDAETIRDLRAQNAGLLTALRVAELKTANSLAKNLCSDHRDKQTGKPCLACTVETSEKQNAELLAALRSIIEWTNEGMPGLDRLERYARTELLIRHAARAAISKAEDKS